MTTNVRKQKTITAIFWSVIAVMLLAMGIYAIRDLPMRLAMKVSPSIHLAIEMSTDNSVYKTVFKNYGNETLDANINRTIEDGNKITLTGDIFNNIYSNEPLYIRITNYTQASDVEDDDNYSNGPALNAYFTAENGVTNYPSYGLENIAPYNGTNNPSAKTFVVVPQTVIVDSKYEFNLKLELSNFVATEYTVTQNLATGIISLNNFATTKAILGHDFETTLIQNDDTKLIQIESVIIGETLLSQNGDTYNYDVKTGRLTIFKEALMDNDVPKPANTQIQINATLVNKLIKVEFSTNAHKSTVMSYLNTAYNPGKFFYTQPVTDLILGLYSINNIIAVTPRVFAGETEITDFCTYDTAYQKLTIPQSRLTGNLTINCNDYWTGNIASSFGGGNGSSGTPYLISTPEQLAYLAQTTNAGNTYADKYFELTNDLYLNDEQFTWSTATGYVTASDGINSVRIGTGIPTTLGASTATTMGALESTYQGTLHQWTPIGVYSHAFYGNFNGNNFVISNCYCNNLTNPYVGLFGYLNGVNIENVIVKNSFMVGIGVVSNIVGYIISSIVENCKVEESFVCANKNELYSESNSGNLCGYIVESTIKNCYSNYVYNYSNGSFAGGLIGHVLKRSNIFNSNCVNSTIISNGSYGYGGFIGLLNGSGGGGDYVKNCYAYGITVTVASTSTMFSKFLGSTWGNAQTLEYCYYEGTNISGGNLSGGSLAATNCSQINGNTLVTPIYGTTVLVDALNAWVTANQTSPATYNHWQVNAGVNGGYPYFVQ